MKQRAWATAMFIFVAMGCANDAPPQKTQNGDDHETCALAITNVKLVPMTANVVKPGQTVKFSRSEILDISSNSAAAGCARIVDGDGLYLMPGLNDLHTHVENNAFEQGFGLAPTSLPFDALMTPYLVNGVTGIRILSGAPDLLDYRRNAAGSDRTPHLVIASPMLSATPPILPEPITRIADDEAAARSAIREYAAAGYDLIKIRRNLPAPVFNAVIDEAHLLGLHVDGHVTRDMASMEQLLNSGQDGFAHLDELAIRTPDDLSVDRLTELLVACGCYVSTAIGVMPNISQQIDNYDGMVAREEMQIVHPLLSNAFWFKPNNPYLREGAPSAFFDDLGRRTSNIVKPLYDAGVPLLAGSDAINPMIVPGYGLLDELSLLVEAGLSPFEALRTATIIPANAVPGFENTGVLEKGHMANAVLLSANPLENLAALRTPEAVILNGYFLDRAELDGRLDAAVNAMQTP